MKNKLRILHLEDNTRDAELVASVLEDGGYSCDVMLVQTQADFSKALQEEIPFDLLITDYTLPSFNGMEALALAREACPDIPFIFVSATIGEERAIQTLQEGAVDYVLKNNLARLVPSVRRALNEAEEHKERKRAEEALRQSEENYRSLFDNSIDAVLLTEPDGGIIAANPEACRIFGRSENELCSLGRAGVVDATDPRLAAALRERAETGKFRGELTLVRKDGTKFPAEVSSVVFRDSKGLAKTNLIIRDITERKLMEEQLRQAQKMEAVGQLSGGVAHDFNNILSAIVGYGHILLMKMRNDDPLREYVDLVLASADRAAHLTHGLLAFSRKQVINLAPVDLNGLVRRMSGLLARLIGEDIQIRLEFERDAAVVEADSGQLEQVLMNLATNARDAMPRGGSLTFKTEELELDAAFIRAHGFGAPGMYVVLSAADTGVGMTEETRKKIFEPFFTTKEVGKGTGLGLAIVYGIIKQHNGYINVYSEPGRGARFTMYLPLIKKEPKKIEEPAVVPEKAIPRGTETVLVAEDDEAIRKLSRIILEAFGYTVIVAEDGEDAVRKFIERQEEIRLVILDMIMPKKTGMEAYEEIEKIKPGVPALFASGYTADKYRFEGVPGEEFDLLLKPVSPKALVRKVREVLDRN